MPSTFLDDEGHLIRDTSTIYNYTSTRTKRIFKASSSLDNNETYLEPVEVLEKIGGLTKMEKAQYDDVFMEAAKTIPIHNRIEVEDLYQAIESELQNRGIDSSFEFGVESMQFPTLVRSEQFDFKSENLYKAPIFKDSEGMTDYTLALFFPDRKEFLLSEIASLVTLSVVFTTIIIIVFIISIYQLVTQKRISEIKSDFINNMTHEFKTPIATINLAVESIKNPIISSDKEKLDRYLQMIRDEIVILTGVSGVGKTFLGQKLSELTAIPFSDADDFHPEANKQKMKSGVPLNDHDRLPWLLDLNTHIKKSETAQGLILACSALKHEYRRILEKEVKNKINWVCLEANAEVIQARLQERKSHFMPASLLQSQLDTYEPTEDALHLNTEESVETLCNAVLFELYGT
tara:strand:+ start:134 stop:1345 length:1212 start_codon:yes stop_codon:yes gene_type:complete